MSTGRLAPLPSTLLGVTQGRGKLMIKNLTGRSDFNNRRLCQKDHFPLSLWENALKLASACIMEYIKVGK
jgi:hypothetical protein